MPQIKIISDIKGIFREIKKIGQVPTAAQRAVEIYTTEDVLPLFEATVATWDHSVEFKRDTKFTLDIKAIRLYTDDDIWNWVSQGTKEHPIYPKKSEFLHFQENFTPKTKKGWAGSQSGGKSGKWTHPRFVEKHKIEAREFEKAIAKEARPKFKQRFLDEYRKL